MELGPEMIKWCSCIIDQYRVDLIDNGVVMHPLHQVFWPARHVVSQIIESELIVRSVSDVASDRQLCGLPHYSADDLIDAVDGESMKLEDWGHPFAVPS